MSHPPQHPHSPSPITDNPPAWRAGMLALALGIIALILGGMAMLVVLVFPAMLANPEFAAQVDRMREQTQIEPRLIIAVMAVLFLAYGVATIVLGILARKGSTAWVIVLLVIAVLVAAFMALSTLVNLGFGHAGEALMPALLAGLHGLLIVWLINALRIGAVNTRITTALQKQFPQAPPQQRQPMQDYYR